MSNQFHNRLVGTIVVVALGVIFLPDILDGKKQRQVEQFSEIPLRPQVEKQATPKEVFEALPQTSDVKKQEQGEEWVITTHEEKTETKNGTEKPITEPSKSESNVKSVPDPKADNKVSQLVKQSAATQKDETKSVKATTKNTTASKAKPKAKNQVAWTLQLGSFNHAGNVNALVKKLRKAGFRAYTLPKTPINGRLTKVFVGPDISKEKIKQLQKDVEEVTKLKGRVVSYNPLETSS